MGTASPPDPPSTTTTTSSHPPPLLHRLASPFRPLLAAAQRSPVPTLAAAISLLALFMYGEDAQLSLDDYLLPDAPALYTVSPLVLPPPDCDLTRGRWVFDNASVPAYREKECSFLTAQVTCTANGRPDDGWQYWRWQPHGGHACSLPTFDARRFMEAMRGKRMIFVGDSLNRNQWMSLLCLVQPILSKNRKKVTKWGSFQVFHAKEYRATIEFYWAPFLVESNSDDPNFHTIVHRIVDPEQIRSHAKHWEGADYLVFNTYIWWMNTQDIKVRRPGARDWADHDEVPRMDAYGRVLKTWSDWLEETIDPAKTSVFFMTISSPHLSPELWGNPNGIKCSKETLPYMNYTEPLNLNHDMRMFDLVAKVAKSTKRVPVTMIDITTMSDYRKDAHTSVYTMQQGKLLTKKQKANPQKFADCIHWCLPGVPDVWNQILYTRILSKQQSADGTAADDATAAAASAAALPPSLPLPPPQ